MPPCDQTPQPRHRLLAEFLDREHWRYRRRSNARPVAGEFVIDGRWTLVDPKDRTSLTLRMMGDFARFMRDCLDVEFVRSERPAEPTISWVIDPPRAATIGLAHPRDPWSFSRTDPQVEAFTLEASPQAIRIVAGHERGLLHGTHYLERLLADRGGPFLKPGTINRQPALTPRISNGVFIKSAQTVEEPGRFSDEYLSLMSHFGVNGIHLYVHLWDLCRNEALPELNTPGMARKIELLNGFNDRLLAHGIDLYLHINAGALPPEHTVFKAHPETRGSRTDIFLAEMEDKETYCLCGSQERVQACYREALVSLFTAAPRLAGGVFIVGGECFYHCFTRPKRDEEGKPACPRCRELDPSIAVAELTNILTEAIKRTGTHKRAFAWPYSAFTWSGDDRAQLAWTERLSSGVSLISNFDCGGEDRTPGGGAGVVFFDYNIKEIGPSPVFAAQAECRRRAKQPIFAKTESNTTPMAFFLPYLPVHHRWERRFASLRNTGVAGYIGQWRFYGMNGSPPEELQYHAVWNPDVPVDRALATIAERDFDLDAEGGVQVVAAWKRLSAAWDLFPWSAMTCGERDAYMRGPFYLGPAHPLIFNEQDDYQLDPGFRQVRADAAELLDEKDLTEAMRHAMPRYVCDLLLALPFGVERYIDLVDRCLAEWTAGVQGLVDAIGPSPCSRAGMELDVCRTIEIHLTSLRNVVRFYQQRDLLWQKPMDPSQARSAFANLRRIALEEVANSERILPILERDCRIGYSVNYGTVYNAQMVRSKLRQCRYVVERELPRIEAVIRFHVWND